MFHSLNPCVASCFLRRAVLLSALFSALACVAVQAAPPKAGEYEEDESRETITPASPSMAWWRDSMLTLDERMQWWREARFGMFVHWGIYSGMGGVWKNQVITTGYTEHIQRRLKIPIPEYRKKVAGSFNPTEFDADAWIKLAKEAGMGYFIITAKHHDGFAMYDSKVSDFNIVQATPFRRDPMSELRDACRKHGIKFGFYYSHAFDWGEPDAPGNDWDYNNPGGDTLIGGRDWWTTTPEFLPKARGYVDRKAIPQLQELIKQYDPDMFWFDTPHKLPPSENMRIMRAVRAASQRVVINGRLLRGMGDYDSTTDKPAEFPPHERDWEGIPTTNESYGWSPFDQSHKPASHFIGLVVKATARGGNTLMNVGPMGNGQIDPKDVAILQDIGRWWKTNGESIRGAGRTPLPVQAWGESTRKGNTLYLQVLSWPGDGKLLVGGLKSNVKRAYLLADLKKPLAVSRINPLDLVIAVPAHAPDPAFSVVAIECDSEPVCDPNRLLQTAVTVDTLRTLDATLNGKSLRYGTGKATTDYVENWTDVDEHIFWSVRLNAPATYDVAITYESPVEEGGQYALKLDDKTLLTGTVKKGKVKAESLGQVRLESGSHTLSLVALQLNQDELMKPSALTLTPVK